MGERLVLGFILILGSVLIFGLIFVLVFVLVLVLVLTPITLSGVVLFPLFPFPKPPICPRTPPFPSIIKNAPTTIVSVNNNNQYPGKQHIVESVYFLGLNF